MQALPAVHIPQEHLSPALAPASTGERAAIGTPSHCVHRPAMPAQHPGHPVGHLPEGHEHIRVCTGDLGAIRTPGHVVEADRVTLYDTYALLTCYIPHPQGAIFAATEQA